ncbi:MAG: hypothetical protein ACOCP8_07650 [archaeon]
MVSYNPYQAKKDKENREAVVKYLKEEIDGLNSDTKKAAFFTVIGLKVDIYENLKMVLLK